MRFVIVRQKIVVVSVSNLPSALFILWLSWGPGETNELALKLQDSRCKGNIRIYPARQKEAVKFLPRVAFMKVSVKEKQSRIWDFKGGKISSSWKPIKNLRF